MGAEFHGGFEETYGANEYRREYIKNTLSKRSPLKIPSSAAIKDEKKNGYEQIKYSWKRCGYSYTSRWHTRTPNAPATQGNSWVVQRDCPGIGFGKNIRPAKHEIMVGKYQWVPMKEWRLAIKARKTELQQKNRRRCWTLER